MDLNTKLVTIYFNGLNLKSDFLYMHLWHNTQMKYGPSIARDLNSSTLCFKDFFHYMFHYFLNGLEHNFLFYVFFFFFCKSVSLVHMLMLWRSYQFCLIFPSFLFVHNTIEFSPPLSNIII